LNKIFIERSFKSKLKFIGEFGHALGIVVKPLTKWDLMKEI
jgi:hypothetical protein